MTKAAAQKYLKKQKPNTFITLRREQFEDLESKLLAYVHPTLQGPKCNMCFHVDGHRSDCPVYLISKLEKV